MRLVVFAYLLMVSMNVSSHVVDEDILVEREKTLYEAGYTKVKVKSINDYSIIKTISALKFDPSSKNWSWKIPKDYDIRFLETSYQKKAKFLKSYNKSVMIYTFKQKVSIGDVVSVIRPLLYDFTFLATSKKFPRSLFISDAEVHLETIYNSLKGLENLIEKSK